MSTEDVFLQEIKHGNDAADCLASAAAAANSLPEGIVQETLHRKQVVRDVQLMMVEILSARSKDIAMESVSSARSDPLSCTSSTESSSLPGESDSDASCSGSNSDSPSPVQSTVALHSGSNHPT